MFESEAIPPAEPPGTAAPMPGQDTILTALREVKDPEVGVNVVDLGLVYAIQTRENEVDVEMTLTTPSCPSAQELPGEVEEAVRAVPGVTDVVVDVVWDPPWDPSRMSEDARLALNMY